MGTVIDLITSQDLDAFVDGELTDARLDSVRRRLICSDTDLRQVMILAELSDSLQSLTSVVLAEPELARRLAEIKKRRAA